MNLPDPSVQQRILREAPARLSLFLFEHERGVAYPVPLAEDFLRGYLDGADGAALERAVEHHELEVGTTRLTAFAFGWCRGRADLLGHRPTYGRVEQWLSRRAGC